MSNRKMWSAINTAHENHVAGLAGFIAMHVDDCVREMLPVTASLIAKLTSEWADMQFRDPKTVPAEFRKFLVS